MEHAGVLSPPPKPAAKNVPQCLAVRAPYHFGFFLFSRRVFASSFSILHFPSWTAWSCIFFSGAAGRTTACCSYPSPPAARGRTVLLLGPLGRSPHPRPRKRVVQDSFFRCVRSGLAPVPDLLSHLSEWMILTKRIQN